MEQLKQIAQPGDQLEIEQDSTKRTAKAIT